MLRYLLVLTPLVLAALGVFGAVLLPLREVEPTESKRRKDNMKLVTVYEEGDMLDAVQAAEHFGYSVEYFRSMADINSKGADPQLIATRIETTPEWRKMYGRRSWYVWEYSQLKEWYKRKQRKPSVKAKTWARKYQPSHTLK